VRVPFYVKLIFWSLSQENADTNGTMFFNVPVFMNKKIILILIIFYFESSSLIELNRTPVSEASCKDLLEFLRAHQPKGAKV
jgi:hypothetical protein